MITAGLAILLSISIIVTEFRGNSASIRRKMLDGYSDSQIMQGIGIQSEFLELTCKEKMPGQIKTD
jgi:hypothetical protein